MNIKKLSDPLRQIAWAFLFLALPVTSFRYFPPALGGSAIVQPLALYAVILLLVFFVLPRLFKNGLPKTLQPLLVFILLALASSLLAVFKDVESVRGIDAFSRALRGVATLGVGASFFLVVALLPRSEADLQRALRWLYAGLAISLVWGFLQAVYVILDVPEYYQWINQAQRLFSTRKLIFNRISGLTYEPSWFADQITFLYLPWLLSAVISNSTVFPWRWRRLTVEAVLLVASIAIMPFTFSRGGLAMLAVLIFVTVIFLRPVRLESLRQKFGLARAAFSRLLQAALILAVLAGAIYLASERNSFFARLWNFWGESADTSLERYLYYIGFGPRINYWETAYAIYEDYPVFGIGLGNYAFYFEEYLPYFPIALEPEILRRLTPDASVRGLITPKHLILRLLAETGLMGTAAFAAFGVAVLGCALYLWLSPDPRQSFWGRAAILGLLSFGLSAFSFDSLALPNMWVVFGMVTAAAGIFSAHPGAEPAVETA